MKNTVYSGTNFLKCITYLIKYDNISKKSNKFILNNSYTPDNLNIIYKDDRDTFNNIMNKMPVWYNENSNLIFVPIWGVATAEFAIIAKYMKYKLVTDYPDNIKKFTFVSDPLYRFCTLYSYRNLNKIELNRTGHPTALPIVGKNSIFDMINKDDDDFLYHSQKKIIEFHKIDYLLDVDTLYSIDYDDIKDRFHSLEKENWIFLDTIYQLVEYVKHFRNGDCHVHHYPTDMWKNKNMFIEENVLDILQKNKTLLKILEESFKDDYEVGCPYYTYMRKFGIRKWFNRIVKYGT